jgi:hypothetical protein
MSMASFEAADDRQRLVVDSGRVPSVTQTPPPPTDLKATLLVLADPGIREREPMEAVELVRHARDRLRDYETEVARLAHESGLSWEKIGRALGMSKQGAQRRYDA